MSKIEDIVFELAKPVVEGKELTLIDVEFKKEGSEKYLRIYIDKKDGVSIDDCQAVNDAMNDILDRENPIDEKYIFEVSSAGLERKLKSDFEYEWYSGEEVEVKLYKALSGIKAYTGILKGLSNGKVEIDVEGEIVSFDKSDVSYVKRVFNF